MLRYFIGMQPSRTRSLLNALTTVLTIVAFLAAQLPRPVFAQSSAQAELLFKEGKQLLADKQYGPACQRLAASQKIDPSANTQLLLGLCYGALGKTASAYNAYLDASSGLPKGSDAQKYAADEAHKLETKLVKVRVAMALVPKDVSITFDDEKPRDKDFVGIDIALDPGDHTVTITASGKHDYSQHFKLGADNSPLTLQVTMTDKTQEEIDAENKAKQGPTPAGPVVVERPETHWSTVKTLGLVGILVGGGALAAAAVMQILALVFQSNATTLQSRASSAGATCTLSTSSNPSGNADCANAISYHQQALGTQTGAIAVGIAGGVVGITGLVMFLVGGNTTTDGKGEEPKASLRVTPLLAPNLAGVSLSGAF